jgi:hypothetical protein
LEVEVEVDDTTTIMLLPQEVGSDGRIISVLYLEIHIQ